MPVDPIALVSRWLHILSAIAAVGGTAFMRLALVPSVSMLADDTRAGLHEAVRSRWSKVVMGAIGFLILSGVYNIFRSAVGLPREMMPLYHSLLLVKLLLALAIFFIASALVGRSAALAGMRQNARRWLTVNLVLAVIVVCISGFLRLYRDTAGGQPAAGTAPAATSTLDERHG